MYSQALVAADHVSVVVLKVTNATSDGVIPGLETIETQFTEKKVLNNKQ